MSVIIIGAGAAGCEAAFRLAEAGIQVEVVEKENQPGGNLNNWYQLFPDRKPASLLRQRSAPSHAGQCKCSLWHEDFR